MQKRKLEALAEAVAHVSGYSLVGGPLYLARNPGGLKAFPKTVSGRKVWPPHDENNNRVFGSVVDGWQALIFDTQLKLQGMSRGCLQPSHTLQDFAISHGQPITAADAYSKWLRRALADDSINKKTELRYFLEEN